MLDKEGRQTSDEVRAAIATKQHIVNSTQNTEQVFVSSYGGTRASGFVAPLLCTTYFGYCLDVLCHSKHRPSQHKVHLYLSPSTVKPDLDHTQVPNKDRQKGTRA